MKFARAGFSASLLLLAACAAAPGSPVSLVGTSWQLQSADRGLLASKADASAITLEFSADRISGYGGCNRYNGAYQLSGANLEFGPVAATKRSCMGDADAVESAWSVAAPDPWCRSSSSNFSCARPTAPNWFSTRPRPSGDLPGPRARLHSAAVAQPRRSRRTIDSRARSRLLESAAPLAKSVFVMPRKIALRRSSLHGNVCLRWVPLTPEMRVAEYRGRRLLQDDADEIYGDTLDTGHTFLSPSTIVSVVQTLAATSRAGSITAARRTAKRW